jgi:phage tail protein X
MALVFQNIATITIPLVDETGSSSQFQLNLQVANLAAIPSIISAVIAAVPGIEALSTASATGLSITLPYREDDVTPPGAGSRVERRGVWDLINVRGNRFSISIPSIRTDVVDNNGYIIRSNPLVVAFEQYLTASSACDSRGVEIGGVVDAREVYRRSTRTSRPAVRG